MKFYIDNVRDKLHVCVTSLFLPVVHGLPKPLLVPGPVLVHQVPSSHHPEGFHGDRDS